MTTLQAMFTLFGLLCWVAGVYSVLCFQSVCRWLERDNDDGWPM